MSSSASRRERRRGAECSGGRAAGRALPRGRPRPRRRRAGSCCYPRAVPTLWRLQRGAARGGMVRYGRRKNGRSFFHTRCFVLDNQLLAYYKKQPKDSMIWMRGRVQKEVHMPYVFLVRFAKAASSFSDQKNDKEKIKSGCNCFDILVWPPGMLMKYNEASSSDYFANGRLERTRSIDGDSVLGAALC